MIGIVPPAYGSSARVRFFGQGYIQTNTMMGQSGSAGAEKKNNSGFLLSSPCAIMEDLNREIGWRDYCDRHIIGELKGK